jgi:hypothetical protein
MAATCSCPTSRLGVTEQDVVANHVGAPMLVPPIQGVTPEEMNRRFKDMPYAADLLNAITEKWRAERETYPGWLVCPAEMRSTLRHATGDVTLSHQVFEHLPADRRSRVIYELTWRLDKTFLPFPDFVADLMRDHALPRPMSGLSKDEHLDLAILALRAAREEGNQKRFDEIAQGLAEHAEEGGEHRAALAYQKALWAWNRLDLAELSKRVAEIEGPDPVWKLRQAALYSALGQFEKTEALITESLNLLRQRQQRDRASLWILSRRAWAEFLARAAELGVGFGRRKKGSEFGRDRDWPLEFKAAKCDPWDELHTLESAVHREVREQSEQTFDLKPHFDAGTFTEKGSGLHFRSWTLSSPDYELDRLCEDVGLPIGLENLDIRRGYTKDALAVHFEATVAAPRLNPNRKMRSPSR